MPLVLRQCSNGGVRLLFHPRWKVEVEVQVEGPEEVEALAAVVALFTSGFNEE